MFPQGFSARSVEPAGTGGQLPISPADGWPVIITGHEMVPVKDKPQYGRLVFNLQIVDGEKKGTEGPFGLNLFVESEQSCKIAAQDLSALCWVTGKLDAKVENELYNIPFRIVVVAQTGEGKENFTKVHKILNADGSKAGSAPGSAPAAAPAAPPQPPAPPAAAAPAQWGAPAAAVEAAAGALPVDPLFPLCGHEGF